MERQRQRRAQPGYRDAELAARQRSGEYERYNAKRRNMTVDEYRAYREEQAELRARCAARAAEEAASRAARRALTPEGRALQQEASRAQEDQRRMKEAAMRRFASKGGRSET